MTTTPNYPVVAPEHIKQSRIIDLTLYKGNPRVHSDVQIERLVNSLKEFGFTNPVLVDDTGNVIAGHGRIAAAKKIGLETVPTITLSHLSEDQRKAYIIADNQLALNSSWDDDLLKKELDNKKGVGGVFIDLKKAFDTVNHQILCNKLSYYGFRGKSNLLIESFLTDRKKYVSINGNNSSQLNIVYIIQVARI